MTRAGVFSEDRARFVLGDLIDKRLADCTEEELRRLASYMAAAERRLSVKPERGDIEKDNGW